jgi:hypothetical protein
MTWLSHPRVKSLRINHFQRFHGLYGIVEATQNQSLDLPPAYGITDKARRINQLTVPPAKKMSETGGPLKPLLLEWGTSRNRSKPGVHVSILRRGMNHLGA